MIIIIFILKFSGIADVVGYNTGVPFWLAYILVLVNGFFSQGVGNTRLYPKFLCKTYKDKCCSEFGICHVKVWP